MFAGMLHVELLNRTDSPESYHCLLVPVVEAAAQSSRHKSWTYLWRKKCYFPKMMNGYIKTDFVWHSYYYSNIIIIININVAIQAVVYYSMQVHTSFIVTT